MGRFLDRDPWHRRPTDQSAGQLGDEPVGRTRLDGIRLSGGSAESKARSGTAR